MVTILKEQSTAQHGRVKRERNEDDNVREKTEVLVSHSLRRYKGHTKRNKRLYTEM